MTISTGASPRRFLVPVWAVLLSSLVLTSAFNHVWAQTSAFTTAQIEAGTGCDWPFSSLATNPKDGKAYGFWRKGAGTDLTYKLIRFDGSGWTTLSTFSASGGSSSIKVPNFDGGSDYTGIAIDALGRYHVVFQGYRGTSFTSERGVWYGLSTDGTTWSFTEIQTFTDPSGFKNTSIPVIEVDGNNQPHVAFLASDANSPRTYTIRYYRYTGTAWVGENAFSQSGGTPASNEINNFDLAIDGTGKAHIAFQRETSGQGRDGGLWYTTNSGGSWATPVVLAAGLQDQTQGNTIGIDTDAANKVHIVYSGYPGQINYTNNVSGNFSTAQINGNLAGTISRHSFHFNSNGDKYFTYVSTGLRFAYQLAGSSGAWTTALAYTVPTEARAANYPSGVLTPSGRIVQLFDNLTTGNGSCGADNTRKLWYATATVQNSNPAPSFTQTPSNAAVCTGQNATFSAGASNATSLTWQESSTSTFSSPTTLSSGGIYLISGSGASSTLTITTNSSVNSKYYRAVASGSGGSTNSTGAQLTVNALPVVSITGLNAAYCKNVSAVTLSGSPTGGSFSIDGNSATSFNPALLSVGAHSVSYSYTNGNGCTNTSTQAVTVNAVPTVLITGLNGVYCKDASAVTLTGSPTGGSFTIDGTTASSFNPALLSVGAHSVVYTYTNGNGCTNTSTQSITVNALPVVSITGLNTAFCKDALAATLTGSPSGGSFTIDGTTATSFNPTLLSVGAHSVVYTYTNGNGCTNTSTQAVTVNALPVVSITGLNAAYCKDASAVTLGGSPTGGSFTVDGSSATSFNPANLSVGSHTVLYSYTNGNGCRNTATKQVTVNALPTPSINGLAAAYCQDAPAITLAPLATPQGGNFAVDGPNATIFNPASLSIGAHTVNYSLTDGNGCTNGATQQVTVKEVPSAPSLLTQTGQSYPGGVSNLTASQNTGTILLTVSGCSGGTINWPGGSSTTFAVSTTATGVLTYQATCTRNGCTSPAATATITIVPTTLGVLHRDADFGNTDNQIIKPYLQLSNAGNDPIPYGEVTIRYWFTSEGNALPTDLSVYYAQLGTDKVKMKYVALAQPRQGAYGYVEYSFDGSAGSLPALASSGPIENGIQKTDRSNFNELDDYSYAANYATYTANSRITAYRNGVIFWGVEPSVVSSQTRISAYSATKDQANPTSQITTRLELRNEGNTSISLQDLSIRYWFTSDNSQPANVYVDYAAIGAANVQARVVQISPVSGADSYVEIKPLSSGTLAPSSSLGFIDFRLVRSDNGYFDQTNDYSFTSTYGPVAQNSRIGIYLGGVLIYGTPPSGAPARLAATEEVGSRLAVRVLGNPVVGSSAEVEISGVLGKPVEVTLVNLQGRVLHQLTLPQAGEQDRVSVPVGSGQGQLLLQVSVPGQQQHVKLLKP